jgi:drug/metabolite transporter (DMT)-like permease
MLRERPRAFLGLGVLEGINLVLYLAALKSGPLPVVVALHLCAPIILIAVDVLARRRRMTRSVVLQLVCITSAILLVAWRRSEQSTAWSTLLGCALAISSAVCVAVLITLVAREAGPTSDPLSAASLQLLMGAALSSPLLLVELPQPTVSAALAAIGAFLLAPGFVLFWLAMRRLAPTVAGILGLNEVVVAAAVGLAIGDADITWVTLLAGLLVLAAVALESRTEGGITVCQ